MTRRLSTMRTLASEKGPPCNSHGSFPAASTGSEWVAFQVLQETGPGAHLHAWASEHVFGGNRMRSDHPRR